MKKIIITLAIMAFTTGLTACSYLPDTSSLQISAPKASHYDTIVEMLQNLHTYKASTTVTYISNKSINTYSTTQVATAEGLYRIDVTGPDHAMGNVTTFDGNNIYQLNKNVNKGLTIGVASQDTKERTSILFTNFAKLYLSETANTLPPQENEKGHHISLQVEYINSYIHTITLHIDNDLNPISLTTKDINGQERIVVTYQEFFYNIGVDKSIFSPTNDNTT